MEEREKEREGERGRESEAVDQCENQTANSSEKILSSTMESDK